MTRVLSGRNDPGERRGEAQYLEGRESCDPCGRRRTRVRDPDVSEVVAEEFLPGVFFHHAVCGVDTDFRCACVLERFRALDERATRVDEIVDDDDLPSGDFAFAHRHLPLVSFPDLPADDEGEERSAVLVGEHRLEPLPGAFVREDDRNVFTGEPLLEELRARLELRRDVRSEEVPDRQCVRVVDDERHRAGTSRRYRRDHLSKCAGRGDLSLVIDPLHRPGGEVGEENLEGLGPKRCERVDRAHLFEDRSGGVEADEEGDVGVLHRVDVVDERVGVAVREPLPGDLSDHDPHIARGDSLCDVLHLGACEEDVAVHVVPLFCCRRCVLWLSSSQPRC